MSDATARYEDAQRELLATVRAEAYAKGQLDERARASGLPASRLIFETIAELCESAAGRLSPLDVRRAERLHEYAAMLRDEIVPPTIIGTRWHRTGSHVSVQFSHPVDPDSVTSETLYVVPAHGGPHLKAVLAWDSRDTTSLVFDEPLPEDKSYKLVVSDAIRRVGGSFLAEPSEFVREARG